MLIKEKCTSLVVQHFPDSKWKKTHYSWYKSKVKTGVIKIPGFAAGEEGNEVKEDDAETDIEDTIGASLSLE